MLYKVNYTKCAIMPDGHIGNIPQGDDTAYMDCKIDQIEDNLQRELKETNNPTKYHPYINSIVNIEGHIVIVSRDK